MNKDELIELYIGKQLSTYKIAEIKGIHNSTVFGWLKKHEIPIRSKKEAWGNVDRPDWVAELPDLVKTKNAQDIANMFNVKYHTVQYHIKKLGLSGTRVSSGTLEKRGRKRQRYSSDELSHLYNNKQMSLAAIGAQFNVTAATVLSDMKRFNIPRRNASECQAMLWTDDKREAARIRAIQRPALTFGQQTDIELMFEDWAKLNSVPINGQFQINDIGHRYDYLIAGKMIIVELDGDYWHSTPRQQQLDARFETEATEAGYKVIRFLRSNIMNKSQTFNELFNHPDW